MHAGDRFIVRVEIPDTGDPVVGAVPDGTPIVVRLRERSDGKVVRAIPLGTDRASADALAERIADDLASSDVDGFVTTYEIGAAPTARVRRAYLGLGSNLGDRAARLQAAIDGLAETEDIAVVAISPVYETEPVGGPDQPDYLNAVVAVDTTLSARQLLDAAQRLEAEAGRDRGQEERWGPRVLDVDVLLVGDEHVEEPDFVVPHPRLYERAFVMMPLADLDPMLAPWVPSGETAVRRSEVELAQPQTQ
jgi:2-amino-4-hydroxy-6-hydroxymethyldihydropteridine diphosphokinase